MSSTEMSKKRRGPRSKFTSMGDHNKFVNRIKKSLYYGQLPNTERLSLPLTELATELFSAAQRKRSLQRLELQEASDVSRSACVSPCSLVLALLYMERLQSSRPSYLRETTPSDLYLVSLMVATKFLQDDGEDDGVINEEWASSAGISTGHLNQLERDFLDAIQWEVYVSEEAFWTRLRGLERDVALNEGIRRGWFSYADLDCLLEKVDLMSLAHSVLTVSAVCLTSYTASVLTLIASTLLVSQIQLSISAFSGISRTSFSPPTLPLSSMDNLSSESQVDPSFTPDFGSVVDDLTANFVLASLDSCNGRLLNDSAGCSDYSKPTSVSFGRSLFELFSEFSRRDNSDSTLGNHFGLIRSNYADWNDINPLIWLQWFKDFNGWFRAPIIWSLESPPDWATTLSHCIDRSASASQSRFIPLQVY